MTLVPFDNRDGWIWMDGALVPWRDAKLHVLTHGFHYASAVFEGERAYRGTIFRLCDHTNRLIDSEDQVGGWPALKSVPAPLDTDRDGMPDDWERHHGLNPNDPHDRNGDQNGDGFTNLEKYLNSL